MRRRGFLGLLGGLAAGAVLDPERLLWVPGKKLISIPALVEAPPAVDTWVLLGKSPWVEGRLVPEIWNQSSDGVWTRFDLVNINETVAGSLSLNLDPSKWRIGWGK